MKNRYLFLTFLALTSQAFAKYAGTTGFPDAPWFTGPLIAPTAHVTPAGKCNIEPYFVVVDRYGNYNSDWKAVKREHKFYNIYIEPYVTIGLTQWMDFAITPLVNWNVCNGKHEFHVCELRTGVDFQLMRDAQDNYLPALKLGLREVIPIGGINHLDPHKYGVDVGRFVDTYQSEVFLSASRLFHLRGDIWMNVRLALAYYFYTRVHVHGLNAFGGTSNTNGFVYPPQTFGFDFAWEINLSKHWVFACDVVGGYAEHRRFKGNPGTIAGESVVMTKGSSVSYQLAPAIEYNWNKMIGIISGAWFTVAGRNTSAFASWMTGVNIYF